MFADIPFAAVLSVVLARSYEIVALFPALVPHAATAAQQPPAVPASDQSQQPIVIERLFRHVRFEQDGTGRLDLSVRLRVQTESGVQAAGQLSYSYNSQSETLAFDSVRVHKLSGGVVTAPPEAVQDVSTPLASEAPMYSDLRQDIVTVPGLRPGDTLEYHAIWTIKAPVAPDNFWYQYDFMTSAVVLQEDLVVDVPRSKYVKVKSAPGVQAEVTEAGDRRVYRWRHANPVAHPDEETERQRRALRTGRAEPHAVELTTFRSWEDVGRWYAALSSAREAPTPEVRAKAAALVRDRRTRRDSIESIYDFVAKNVRYVSLSFGVGRYQPHGAGEVLANQYGDCKDKHTLLAALLASVGLRAYAALISSGLEIDPDVPAPSQFDHVISAVPEAEDLLWLDTTPGVAPFAFLLYGLRGKQALVIPGVGTPGLRLTPHQLPVPGVYRVDVDAEINELGTLRATVRHTVRGDAEVLFRIGFRAAPQPQWQQLAKLLASEEHMAGEVSNVRASDPAATLDPFEFQYQVTNAGFLDWSKRRVQVSLPVPELNVPQDTADTDASLPHQELGTQEVGARLKLVLPSDVSARLPVPITLSRPYAEYRSSYALVGDTLTAERSLHLNAMILSRADTRDYAAFVRAISQDEHQQLGAHRLAATGQPAIPPSATADELHRSALAALNNGDLRAAVRLLRRVVELEPRHQWAWNNLGRAFLRLGLPDSAIADFRKQIEINPYDQYAYNNLGLALWRDHKYVEAREAFTKQLQINPLDRYAHANIGRMFAEEHRDSAAVSELEQAASITAEDAQVHVDLGKAYLAVHRSDKAQGEFDRAVELAPSPTTWNNVAYAYAIEGLNLDRAEQYARSAVDATAASLRNVTLDHVELKDVAAVVSLGAFWDTLGWVYFRQGDTRKAERYVRAAWLLNMNGEVGDHLAQIEERLGGKDEAAKTYALALAARRPLADTRPRLAKLLGHDQGIDGLVERARTDLIQLRTVRLGTRLKEDLQGSVTLLFGPGPRVEDLSFTKGSAPLRVLDGAIRSATYPVVLPDSTPVKIVRRGVVTCSSATGNCAVVLEESGAPSNPPE